MARKSNGWVKIFSKILEEDLTPSQFKFFVGSILLANPIKTNGAGTVDLSVRQLSGKLKMSPTEIWRREKELDEQGMITIFPNNKGFTINKYLFYQGKSVSPAEQKSEDKKDESVSPAEQSVSPAEQTVPYTKQSVSPAEQSVSYLEPKGPDKKYKKIKKYKEDKEGGPGETEIPNFIDKETWDGFVEMRKKIKAPMTDKAVNLLIGKLTQFKELGYDPNEALNESIMNNWKGVFLPKGAKDGTHQGKSKEPGAESFKSSFYEPDN